MERKRIMGGTSVTAHPTNDGILWCRDSQGKAYAYDEYLRTAKAFHGYAAPGLVIGGKMVHLALCNLPDGVLFDVQCETGNCLPDAVQLLTPCTIGNGWLKIIPFFRYAITLYDKFTGKGFRVCLDAKKVESWSEIKTWFFKLKPKTEQNSEALLQQIHQAGADILEVRSVRMALESLRKQSMGIRKICPICKEAYPAKHGMVCRACQISKMDGRFRNTTEFENSENGLNFIRRPLA